MRRLARLAVTSLLVRLLLGDLLSSHALLGGTDALRLYLPLRAFIGSELAAGRFPTWFPYDGLGTSTLGGVAAPLYPLTLLSVVTGAAASLTLQVVLEGVGAGVGSYLLARELGAAEPGRWLAALGYGASGYLLSVIDNLPYHSSAALLPWVVLFAERLARLPVWNRGVLLGGALACTVWASDFQAALLQAAFAAVIVLCRGREALARRAVALTVGAATSLSLSLPCAGAAWATATESGRRAGLPLEKAEIWSLHPLRLLELALGPFLSPGVRTSPFGLPDYLGGYAGRWFAPSEYVGVLVVLAAGVGLAGAPRRIRWLYGGTCGTALLLALGRWGGLYGLLHRALPLWSAFRYPEKMMPWALLALGMLAGLGASGLTGARVRGVALGLLVLGLGLSWWASPDAARTLLQGLRPDLGQPHADLSESLSLTMRVRALAGVGVLGAFALLSRYAPRFLPWFTTALAAVQAIWVASALRPAVDASFLEITPAFASRVLAARARPFERICSWPAAAPAYTHAEAIPDATRDSFSELQALLPDHAARFGLGSLVAYQPGLSQQLVDACLSPPLCGTTCTRRLAARWAALDPVEVQLLRGQPTLRVRAKLDDPQLVLVEDEGARELVSTPGIHKVANREAIAESMKRSANPVPEALMVGDGGDLVPQASVRSWARPTPSRIEAELDAHVPTMAVITEQLGHGWRATLDGAPVPIASVDLVLGAVEVPAGHHHLELTYRPPGWPWAWIPYVMGVLAVVAAFIVQRRPVAPQ